MNQDPSIDSAVGSAPSSEEIRERAYDLWDRHHRPDGFDLHFWFMAERELKVEKRQRLERGV